MDLKQITKETSTLEQNEIVLPKDLFSEGKLILFLNDHPINFDESNNFIADCFLHAKLMRIFKAVYNIKLPGVADYFNPL